MSQAEARAQYVAALERDLSSLTEQLSAMPDVLKVVLFGSYAAGRRDLLTDLDLLVVMDSPLGFVERAVELTCRLHCTVALDLLVYTPAELECLAERPFIKRALREGKVLYEARQAG